MADLAMIDVPYLVQSQGGTVNGVLFIGVLVGEVEIPEHFRGVALRDRSDRYAVIDLVGVVTKSGRYYARGRVLTVVDKRLLAKAEDKQSGRLALVLSGGSIRINNRGGVTNFISMARWSKGTNNTWQVSRVAMSGFRRDEYPEFMDVVAKAFKNNWNFEYPVDISPTYTDACEGYEFNYPNGDSIDSQQSSVVPKEVSTSQPKVTNNGVGIDPGEQSSFPPMNFGSSTPSLGVSNSSNISALVQNRNETHTSVKQGRSRVVNRDKLADRSANADKAEEALTQAREVVYSLVDQLSKSEDNDESFADLIAFTAEKLKSSWDRRKGAYTGRQLFKDALDSVITDLQQNQITDQLSIMGTALVDEWNHNTGNYPEDKLVLAVSSSRIKIYLRILEILLGIRGSLVDSLTTVVAQGIDILALLKENPYNLCLVYPSFDIEELDKLAMFFGIDLTTEGVIRSRNVAYMHNYMLDSTNRVISDNTIVKYSELAYKLTSGFVLSKRSYEILALEGTVIKRDNIESLEYYIESSQSPENFALPLTGWNSLGKKYVLTSKLDTATVIQDYLDTGLGILLEFNGVRYIADYIYISKEMYVYNRLRELCEDGVTDITPAELDKCIKDFEELKTKELSNGDPDFKFTLEERRAQAVHLVSHRVMCMTGPAGSGKTTTAEALVYTISSLLGVKEEEIFFCTPTNRAANRLKEVVKRRVRTINSLFGVGGKSFQLKDPDDIKKKSEIKVLIVDETSMPTILLMYEMLLRIDDGTRIFFLGDIEQLAPIGSGKPFANMLSFLPTVVLNVTKRASEKSGITYNAKKIIYESDGVITDLDDKPDFRIINEKDQNLAVSKLLSICAYHLGRSDSIDFTSVEADDIDNRMSPDDIQVISPLNKNVWGTVNLNPQLQNIFNPHRPGQGYVVYARGVNDSIEFRLGDRVVHTRTNQKDRERLIHMGGNSFTFEETTGIYNAEQGKIMGFFKASDLDFSQESKEKEEKLKDIFKGSDRTVFVGVSYSDISEETGELIDFVILYRADMVNSFGTQVDVVGFDLRDLDLAYALTTHKLQGSEAKLVIVIMLPVGGIFISRNMIYTAATRGKKACYMIGDILGRNSTVTKGRKVEQISLRTSLPDLF